MIRAHPQSLTIGLLFALLAMNFIIATISHCVETSSLRFTDGPFCSVEHASTPIHTEKNAPEMALIQEIASILTATMVFTLFSKRILEKTLVRFFGLISKIGRRKHLRPRTITIPFDQFLPQISSAHGF